MKYPSLFIFMGFALGLSLLDPFELRAQGSFSELVDRSFGSKQELVNGIQFSNQYIRSEGQPYWIDGHFRKGSVCINQQWYEQVKIRYNLYSQKLELEYHSPEGHLNQIMTVPENISDFSLEGYVFRRMQFAEELPAYYQVVSSGTTICYVGWSRDLLGNSSSGTSFAPPERRYRILQGDQWKVFRDQRTYLRVFPKERKRDFKRLLRQRNYNFQRATTREMVEMLLDTMRLLEEGGGA
ncbi:MAG: hypothetical protein P1P86_13070 [Bacteroidales bacterium]|nr:hypothetical protein [Bacteroidales bacterium]